MSVSDTTDAVTTVKDILEDTTDSDWTNTGSKPPVIEYQWESTQNEKLQRAHRQDAVYVWSPAEGSLEQFAARYQSYLDNQVVNVDPWTTEGHSRAASLSADIRDITNDYVLDNQSSTKWRDIRPETENDIRQETNPERSDVYRIITLVRLRARRTA